MQMAYMISALKMAAELFIQGLRPAAATRSPRGLPA
jgi:hypothetical protein